MIFVKLSIAVFLLRIAVSKVYKWILKVSMVVVTVLSLTIVFFNIFACNPVAFQWDPTIEGGVCVSYDVVISSAYAFSALSIVSDWFYALLPIPLIWNVKMNIQTKLSVYGILSLGIL